MARFLSRTYWVAPGKLLAGPYPGEVDRHTARENLRELIEAGVRHIIDLTEAVETARPGGRFFPYAAQINGLLQGGKEILSRDRISIRDTWIPTRAEMCRLLDRIDESTFRNRPVYVHCMAGRGRTGTVAGCYLARHGIADGRQILDYIASLRCRLTDAALASPETPQQIDLVLSWVEGE